MKAVYKNGVIYPLEPVPAEWEDGTELDVENPKARSGRDQPLDKWFEELEAMVAQNDPQDVARLKAALEEANEQAKAQVRREMGGT